MLISQKQHFIDVMDGIGASARSGEEWLISAAIYVDQQADKGDPLCGKLRKELAPAGRDSEQYRHGVEAFLHTMGRTGNSYAAMRDACYSAGLMPPPADNGPIDRMVDRSRARRTSGGRSGLREVWKKLNEPRRH